MGEENKNWFARHRTAVLGIAIAVLILNLVVMVVVPTQTPVELSQTVPNMRWTTKRLRRRTRSRSPGR